MATSLGLTAIKGKRSLPDSAKLRSEINLVLGNALLTMENDYRKTFSTWRTKPRLFRRRIRNGEFDVGVYPNSKGGQHWYWTSEGTRPHPIRARKAKRLRFFTGGTAKTRRGILQAGAGRKGDVGPHFPKEVNHPGTEARNFDDIIARNHDQLVDRLLDQTFRRLGL